jgi:hypothetical protein
MPLNLDKCLEQLYRGEILSEAVVKELCEMMKESLLFEPNVHILKSPLTVVGDIHGYSSIHDRFCIAKYHSFPPFVPEVEM